MHTPFQPHFQYIPLYSHIFPPSPLQSPKHSQIYQQERGSRKRRWLSTRKPERHAHERWFASHSRVAESNYIMCRSIVHVSFAEETRTSRDFST